MKKIDNNVLLIVVLLLVASICGAYLYKVKRTETNGDPRNGSQNQWNNWGSPSVPGPVTPPTPTPPPAERQPSSYKEALEISKATNKPIFVCFGAEWCSWCKRLEKETLADPQVQQALKGYVVYHADQDKERALADQFKVTSIPAYFVIASGNITKQGKGFRPPAAFIAWLNSQKYVVITAA